MITPSDQEDPDRLAVFFLKIDFLRRVSERHAKSGHTVTYPDAHSCWSCLTEEALLLAQDRDAWRLLSQQYSTVIMDSVRAHDVLTQEHARLKDAAEMLWVVLANVSESDWAKQTPEWQEAAARWRDNYFVAVKPDLFEGTSVKVQSTDEKADRDNRKQFSQVEMDHATKPLHAETERLKNAVMLAIVSIDCERNGLTPDGNVRERLVAVLAE